MKRVEPRERRVRSYQPLALFSEGTAVIQKWLKWMTTDLYQSTQLGSVWTLTGEEMRKAHDIE
jgi:hypothetical protein